MNKETSDFLRMVQRLILEDREKALALHQWLAGEIENDGGATIMLDPSVVPAVLKALQGSTDQLIKLLMVIQRDDLATSSASSGSLFSEEIMRSLEEDIEKARINVLELEDSRKGLECSDE